MNVPAKVIIDMRDVIASLRAENERLHGVLKMLVADETAYQDGKIPSDADRVKEIEALRAVFEAALGWADELRNAFPSSSRSKSVDDMKAGYDKWRQEEARAALGKEDAR